MSDGQTILISGGTGSFGRAMTAFLLKHTTYKVRIFSRDEAKHEDMACLFPSGPRITYILGDVRNRYSLTQALDGCWACIHAAALKRVWAGERYADEFIQTNVIGSMNIVDAALDAGVKRSMLISSDKAYQPVNAYGATKKLAEAIFCQANVKGVSRDCIFATSRGGNVWGSNGSVASVWRAQIAAGMQPVVTDPDVTRFHMEMPFWTKFVWDALQGMRGGEIFTPQPPAWRLGDLADALGVPYLVVGPRQGDKKHESLTDDYTSDKAPRMSLEELRRLWAERRL